MRRERTGRTAAIVVSALLHAGLLIAALVYWPKVDPGGGAPGITPVTIVAQGPVGNTTAPLPETPQDMATPDPVPDAPPAIVAPPSPALDPTPPPPKTVSKQPTPPVKPGPGARAPASDSFLDDLARSLKPGGGARQSGGPQGPAVAKTGQPVAASGGCLSSSNPCPWKEGIGDKLQRLWNPNCDVEGGASVRLLGSFTLNAQGYLVGEPVITDERTGRVIVLTDESRSSTDVITAAGYRARSAIKRGQAFDGIPSELVGRKLPVRFNANEACR